MRASPLKSSFNAGEISPLLAGRTDVAKYANGCFKLSNFIPTVQGPARRRPGTRYVTNTKGNNKVWLSRFEYSVGQSYVLEWGNYYLRFYYNNARLMVPDNSVEYEIATPYSSADLTTSEGTFALDMVQSADVVYIVHPSYPPHKLSRVGHQNWTLVFAELTGGPLGDLNTDQSVTVYSLGEVWTSPHPFIDRGTTVTTTTALGFALYDQYPHDGKYEILMSSQTGFWDNLPIGGSLRIEPTDLSLIKPWTAGQEVAHYGDKTLGIQRRSDGKVYTCATDITLVSGKSLQCGGDMPIHDHGTQCDGGGAQVEGTAAQRQGVDWTFTDYGFTEYRIIEKKKHTAARDSCSTSTGTNLITTGRSETGLAPSEVLAPDIRIDRGMYVSGTGIAPGTKVTALTSTGVRVHPYPISTGSGRTITFSEEYVIAKRISKETVGALDAVYDVSPGGAGGYNNPTIGSAVVSRNGASAAYGYPPAVRVGMVVVSPCFTDGTTLAGLTYSGGYLASYTMSTTAVQTDTASLGGAVASIIFTSPSTRWRKSGWVDGYPTAVTFFRERLVFGAGRRIYCSQSGDFENFSSLNKSGNVTASTAITASITGDQVNSVQWLASQKALLIGTDGAEFAMMEAGSQDPFGPGNVKIEQHSAEGSRNGVHPARVGTSALFVQRAGKKLKDASYDFQRSGYSTKDLTVLAEHVTRDAGIVQLAWHKEPYTVLWCVRSDGTLLGLTYNNEQDVTAWHSHPMGGGSLLVESIAVIPTPDKTADQLWLAVNNGGIRYIMFMETEAVARSTSFYVDAGLSYSGSPATLFSGLSHITPSYTNALADVDGMKRLGVAADNSAAQVTATTSSSVTIANAASVVSVGLNYESALIPTSMDAGGQDGTSQGKLRRTSKLSLGLFETRGGQWKGTGTPYYYPAGSGSYNLKGWNNIQLTEQRDSGEYFDTGPRLFSGVTVIDWEGDYVLDDTITIRQCEPLPMTVTTIMPQFKVYDR